MRRTPLVLALALALTAPAAPAAQTTLGSAGVWTAAREPGPEGRTLCTLRTRSATTGRELMLAAADPDGPLLLRARRTGWAIPPGTRLAVVLTLGREAFAATARGGGDAIEWSQPDRLEHFLALFRAQPGLQLAFPDGDEPAWRVPLDGSSAMARRFSACLLGLGPARPTQPFRREGGTTQPFAAPPGEPL